MEPQPGSQGKNHRHNCKHHHHPGLGPSAQLKVVVLALLLLALGWGWGRWLAPWLGLHVVLDAVLKTLLLATVALAVVYKWRISQSVNDLLKKFTRAQ